MSTTTSQQTLIDGLEENLAAYDEPWGTAVAPSQSEVSYYEPQAKAVAPSQSEVCYDEPWGTAVAPSQSEVSPSLG